MPNPIQNAFEDLIDAAAKRLPPLRAFTVKDLGVDRFEKERLNDYEVVRAVIHAYFRAEFDGLEHIPKTGAALMVGNHGRTGFDAFVMAALAPDGLKRPVRALADRNLFRIPGLRDWMAACGAVQGTRENAVRLLKEGNLVVVYPGGAREVMKQEQQAYQLLWGDRSGFIQVAAQAGVPIIPFAGIGVEEFYHNTGWWNAFEKSHINKLIEQVVGQPFPVLPPMTGLGPLPHPVKLNFYVGAPHDPCSVDLTDADALLQFQKEVRLSVEGLIHKGQSHRQKAT